MPAARACTPVVSKWIEMAILMCDNTLSVLFSDGNCINYRNSSQAMYLAMIGAPSPGRSLRQNLYRILPYQRIALPCPPAGCGGVQTTCCGNALPHTLHATVTNGGGTVVLTFDGTRYWTAAGIALTCGTAVSLRFNCVPGGTTVGDLGLDYTCNGTTWLPMALDLLTASCNPLSGQYQAAMFIIAGCGTCAGTFLDVTVTL